MNSPLKAAVLTSRVQSRMLRIRMLRNHLAMTHVSDSGCYCALTVRTSVHSEVASRRRFLIGQQRGASST